MREKASAAAAGGDQGAADALNKQADQLESYEELVKLNVTLTSAEADLAAMKANAEQAESLRMADAEKALAAIDHLAEANRQIIERTGNRDAIGDP